jgi:hypothetical protein
MTAPRSLDRGRDVVHAKSVEPQNLIKHGPTVVRPSKSKIGKLYLLLVAVAVFQGVLRGYGDGLGSKLGLLAFTLVMLGALGWRMWLQRRNERLVADGESVTYLDWRARATRIGRDEVSQASLLTVQPVRFSSITQERLVVVSSSPVPPLWFRTNVWNRDELRRLFDRIDVPFVTVNGVHRARELPAMFPRLRLPLGERRPVVFQLVLLAGLSLIIGLFILVAVVLV